MRWLLRLLFPRMISLREHNRIVRTLREQIERDKRKIKELMDEKEIVLGSSLKQARKNEEILHLLKKADEKISEKSS